MAGFREASVRLAVELLLAFVLISFLPSAVFVFDSLSLFRFSPCHFLPSSIFPPTMAATMAATNDKLDEAIRRLSRNDATLTTLSHIGVKDGAAAAGRLAEALATNSTLTTLELSANKVGDEGAGRLAEALVTNSTLTTLYLFSSEVGDEGAGRLGEAIATNSTLTTLLLSDNQVGDEGAGRLAEALATNSTLTTLNLCINGVGDEGAGRLIEALATNSSLTAAYFKLDRNTRYLLDAHLDRNKGNLEKKSASLFFMLLPSLSLNNDESFD